MLVQSFPTDLKNLPPKSRDIFTPVTHNYTPLVTLTTLGNIGQKKPSPPSSVTQGVG